MEAGLNRAFDIAHDFSVRVLNRKYDCGRVLQLLGLESVPGRECNIFILRLELFLSLAPSVFLVLQRLRQVVSKRRAEGRIFANETRIALTASAIWLATTQWFSGQIPACWAYREQHAVIGQHARAHIAQRRVVVENIKTASKRRANQIVLARLNDEIAERDVWRSARQFRPVVAAVHREKHAKLGTQKHQSGFFMVLYDAPQYVAFRQVVGDAAPRTTAVSTAQDIRRKITALVVVDNNVNRVGVVQIGFDVIDKKALGYAGQAIDLTPRLAIVFAYLDQAIVGADIDQSCNEW